MTDLPLSEPYSSGAPPDSARSGLLRWLVAVVAAAFVVSSVAPNLPPAWKRLGLTYAVLGGLIGTAAGWFASRIRSGRGAETGSLPVDGAVRPTTLPPSRRLMWLVLVATLGALVNTALLSSRQHRIAVEAGMARDPQARAYLEMLKTAARANPESSAELDLINRRMSTGFREYLAFRFSQLTKNRPSPVPELLWSCEVVLGLLAAGVAFRIVSKGRSTA